MTQHLYLSLEGRDMAPTLQALWDGIGEAPRWPRRSVCIWLSGGLARPFIVGPISGLRGWREAQDAAAAMARGTCGLDGPCTAFVESSPEQAPALATAVETSLLDALHAGARERRLRIAAIRPAWALACEPAAGAPRRADGLLCLREPDAVTVLAYRSGRFSFAATYAPSPAGSEMCELVTRLTASSGLEGRQVAMAEFTPAKGSGAPTVRWIEAAQEATT